MLNHKIDFMIPKNPIILGIVCVLILFVSIAGMVFFEDSFSGFMNSTPSENNVKSDSKTLSEINSLGLVYQNSGDKENLEKQKILLRDKIKDVAVNSVGIDKITLDLKSLRIPFEEASDITQSSSDSEPFPICGIPKKIPIHLQKINNTEMFQLFSEKYSQYEIELIIVDERFADSDIHYAFLAKTDNDNKIALTFFDVNSCADKLTNDYDYFISCNDKKQNERMSSIKQKHVIASLEHEEFCIIPLSPIYQSFYDYGKNFSDKIDEIEEKIFSGEITSQEHDDSSLTQSSELSKMKLLRDLTWRIAYETIDEKEIQEEIQEYEIRYGGLPLELQKLLDARLLSPSEYNIEVKDDDDDSHDENEYANTLSQINQQAITHQKNGELEKFDEQMLLMQQKQKEIATKILKVNISNVYIDENWNFPFQNASDIEPFPGIEQTLPICNIPENISAHLKIIKNSEMFSMFSEKYSQNNIEFEVSDERNHNSVVHYSIRAISEDQNRIASMFLHVDSCTGNISIPYNLDCGDNVQVEEGVSNHLQTRFIDEIQSSLDSKEFCVIELEPWHQEMREYHTGIGAQLDQLTKNFEAGNEDVSQEKLLEFHFEFQRLGLLNDLVRSATSGTFEDENTPELILEYEDKYDSLPDELVQLLEMREQHFSSLLNK